MLMTSQHRDKGTVPAEGDVRFNDDGQLETFDGTAWVQLQRISDAASAAIFRYEVLLPAEQGHVPGEQETPDQAGAADGSAST